MNTGLLRFGVCRRCFEAKPIAELSAARVCLAWCPRRDGSRLFAPSPRKPAKACDPNVAALPIRPVIVLVAREARS